MDVVDFLCFDINGYGGEDRFTYLYFVLYITQLTVILWIIANIHSNFSGTLEKVSVGAFKYIGMLILAVLLMFLFVFLLEKSQSFSFRHHSMKLKELILMIWIPLWILFYLPYFAWDSIFRPLHELLQSGLREAESNPEIAKIFESEYIDLQSEFGTLCFVDNTPRSEQMIIHHGREVNRFANMGIKEIIAVVLSAAATIYIAVTIFVVAKYKSDYSYYDEYDEYYDEYNYDY